MSSEPLIEARDVAIGYGRRAFLQGISFELEAGDFFGLVGPNGAGKSTLLYTILGRIPAVRGTIKAKRGIRFGYVPQRQRLDPIYPLAAVEVVCSGGMGTSKRGQGWWPFRCTSRAEALKTMERLGVARVARTPFRDLSGGQQQRVLMARALVREPDVLILDEPTAGMDVPTEMEILDFVEGLNRDQRTTVIVVVHHITLVAGRANRMALINKDLELFAVGSAQELLSSEKLSELYRSPVEVVEAEGRTVVRARRGDP